MGLSLPKLPTVRMTRRKTVRHPTIRGYHRKHAGTPRGFRAHHVKRVGHTLVLHHPHARPQHRLVHHGLRRKHRVTRRRR